MAYKLDTLCVQGGYRPQSGGERIPPISQSTTYYYANTQEMADLFDLKGDGYFYTRLANPTVAAFEGKVAALEGGVAAIGCASGMSATTLAALTVCGAGDNIVSSSAIYGGTFNLFAVTLPKVGIETRFFDPDAPAEEIEKLIDDKTKIVFTETIANPSIKVLDFGKIAAIAQKHGVLFAVDNTLATPVLCRPFEHGANLIIHSSSKYLDGHAAALGGVIVDGGNFDWGNGRYPLLSEPSEGYHGFNFWKECGKTAFATRTRCEGLRDIGPCISPFNAFLLTQGLETLSLRVQRSVDNALAVAEWLEKHPKIEHVSYPGLKSSKYHTLAKKYLRNGFGGVLTFRVKGSAEQASKIVDNLGLISHLANVGDAKTLLIHPASTTHAQLGEQELAASGVYPNLLRLSLGIEHIDDIKEDLNEALKHL